MLVMSFKKCITFKIYTQTTFILNTFGDCTMFLEVSLQLTGCNGAGPRTSRPKRRRPIGMFSAPGSPFLTLSSSYNFPRVITSVAGPQWDRPRLPKFRGCIDFEAELATTDRNVSGSQIAKFARTFVLSRTWQRFRDSLFLLKENVVFSFLVFSFYCFFENVVFSGRLNIKILF